MTEPWDPDWVISPGEILLDWMDENGFVVNGEPLLRQMALICSMEPEVLRSVLRGRRRVGAITAAKLQQGTGLPAKLWLKLEQQFRQGRAEGKSWVR